MASRSAAGDAAVMPAKLIADIVELEQLSPGSDAARNYLGAALYLRESITAFRRGDSASAVLAAALCRECPDGQFMFRKYGYNAYFEFVNKACCDAMRSTSNAPDAFKRSAYLVGSDTMLMAGLSPRQLWEILRAGLSRWPHYAPLWKIGAEVNALTGQWVQCLRCLKTLEELNKGKPDAMLLHDYAMCYMQQKEYKKSLQVCERYFQLNQVGWREVPIMYFLKAFVMIQMMREREPPAALLVPVLHVYHQGRKALRERLPMLTDNAPFYGMVSGILHSAQLVRAADLAPGVPRRCSEAQVESTLRQLSLVNVGREVNTHSTSSPNNATAAPSSAQDLQSDQGPQPTSSTGALLSLTERKALKNQKKYQKKKEKKQARTEAEGHAAGIEEVTTKMPTMGLAGKEEDVIRNDATRVTDEEFGGDYAFVREVLVADEESDDEMPGLIPALSTGEVVEEAGTQASLEREGGGKVVCKDRNASTAEGSCISERMEAVSWNGAVITGDKDSSKKVSKVVGELDIPDVD